MKKKFNWVFAKVCLCQKVWFSKIQSYLYVAHNVIQVLAESCWKDLIECSYTYSNGVVTLFHAEHYYGTTLLGIKIKKKEQWDGKIHERIIGIILSIIGSSLLLTPSACYTVFSCLSLWGSSAAVELAYTLMVFQWCRMTNQIWKWPKNLLSLRYMITQFWKLTSGIV